MAEGETKKRSWLKIGCLGLLAVFGLLFVVGMIGNALMTPEERAQLEAERQAEKSEREAKEVASAEKKAEGEINSATKLTAMQLSAAFSENEVAAQAALKGKPVLITGTIDSISLDFMDEPVVSLASGNQFQSVQLDFDENDVEATSGLRKGQTITALCQEVGEAVGTPMLDGCQLQ
jgi:tRNA_anti-like